jgi:hypothetical protein
LISSAGTPLLIGGFAISVVHCATRQPMKPARTMPVPPRKGRQAARAALRLRALGASPSRLAQRDERGAECRGSKPACAGLDGNEERPPLADAPRRKAPQGDVPSYAALSQ